MIGPVDLQRPAAKPEPRNPIGEMRPDGPLRTDELLAQSSPSLYRSSSLLLLFRMLEEVHTVHQLARRDPHCLDDPRGVAAGVPVDPQLGELLVVPPKRPHRTAAPLVRHTPHTAATPARLDLAAASNCSTRAGGTAAVT